MSLMLTDFATVGIKLDPRVRTKVRLEGECWMWHGARQSNGYGYFVRRQGPWNPGKVKGVQRKTYVHRHAYEAYKGPIPEKHSVHHTCFNRTCLNPRHLAAVTNAVNNSAPMKTSNRSTRRIDV